MRETKIKLFMLMKLEKGRNELGWLIRYDECIANHIPEEDYPPMPLLIPPDYTKKVGERIEKAAKGILSPTLNMIVKTYYPLPACQAPVHPRHPETSSCSQTPMLYTEPESLGDDQTKSASFGAQGNGQKEEQLETSLAVQPDDITGKHRDREQNPLEREYFSEDEDKVVADALRTRIRGKKTFFKPRLGWTSKQHKSPLAVL